MQYAKYYAYNHDRRKLHIAYSERLRSIQFRVLKELIVFLNAKVLQVIHVT